MDEKQLVEFLKNYFAERGGTWTGMSVVIDGDKITIERNSAGETGLD